MPGWWDDDDIYNPEELEDLAQPVRYALYGATWDYRTRDWVCICPLFRRSGKCRHTVSYRRTTDLNVKEEYL
jgi:hypothetical protein